MTASARQEQPARFYVEVNNSIFNDFLRPTPCNGNIVINI